MEYQLNKYTTITYSSNGMEVTDRIPHVEGETPEQHEAEVQGFIAEMHRIFESLDFKIGTSYIYDGITPADPTMEG